MPRIKEITVSVTRNLWSQNPNGSTTHQAGVTVELDKDDNLEEVEADLRVWCKQRIREAFRTKQEKENGASGAEV